MKATEKAVCVYRDLNYAASTRQEIEQARQLVQSLLDEWHGLNIGVCTNLDELLMRPERAYKNAIDKLVEIPATTGRFAVKKAAHIDTLELPDPSQLYALAKMVRQRPFCASTELWQVKDTTVEIVEAEAFYLVDARSIYATNPEAIKLARDLEKLCELYNSLNERTGGQLLAASPWTFNYFRGTFELKQKANGGLVCY